MSHVHIVYTHPSDQSFTREVLDAFVGGLEDSGHTYTISDLYEMDFHTELTLGEYQRESGYHAGAPVHDDVAAEHAKLDAADVWAFIYPVWWADSPARLKGWFDRVWTAGFAHSPMNVRVARKALVLCTAGYSLAELEASGCYQAMKTVMLTDRIGQRAESSEFVVFGGSVLRSSSSINDADHWARVKAEHLARAAELGRSL